MAATKTKKQKAKKANGEGEVVPRFGKTGISYALRFVAYGEREYLTLDRADFDGLDHAAAQELADEKLKDILAEVRLGIWIPPKRRVVQAAKDGGGGTAVDAEPQRFGPFATGLVDARDGQVSENTTDHDRWALQHLMPFFRDYYLFEIDIAAVDAYRLFKVRESEARQKAIDRGRPKRNDHNQVLKPLSAVSINKTIDVLQFILAVALERKLISENSAAGSKRRLVLPPKRPVHLDSAGHIEALLEVAATMDREPKYHCCEREAIIATLIFAGPRAHEICHLQWRDVDLANGRIFVGRSKTQAGLREIPLLPILRSVLATFKVVHYRGDPDALVFPNIDGEPRNKDTLRTGVLDALFKRADRLLVDRGKLPLPQGVTAHKLRHTFASILVACGEDPHTVMRHLGHTDPLFTLRVYTHMMNRDPEERQRLKALVRGELVIARQAPIPSSSLEAGDYELPILRALVELGGASPRPAVLAAVGAVMANRHTAVDYEELPSGPPRWEARVGKARTRLVQRGWLEAGTPRGQWKISKIGRAKARRAEVQKISRPPARKAELAVAA
ncbi:MAG TPA: tyrosine-type recombinase/integrase [Solirubrobacterales bacterium]|nr:tyrosine-type recombinase/integrase [Solirubrobacterales bacterium]